ncbi:MAG: hypothetical protein KDD44_10550, partial [Bdellovibrionales bacterium]|nr:hypothetical protein [Bdellovibrionales bacterium]
FPPALCGESVPTLRACEGLARFFGEFGIGFEHQQVLTQSLAGFPDSLMSDAAIAYLSGISDCVLSPALCAIAESRGGALGLGRMAMAAVRSHAGVADDWLVSSELQEADIQRFDRERQLGFLPWICFPGELLFQPGVRQLAELLIEFEYNAALRLTDKLVAEEPDNLFLRLQQAFFPMHIGEIDVACEMFRALITELGAEEEPAIFNSWAMCELARGNVDAAVRHINTAYRLVCLPSYESGGVSRGEVATNLSWVRIVAEQFDEALVAAREAVLASPSGLTARLNQAGVLRMLGREEEAVQVERELLLLAPLDARVFHNQFGLSVAQAERTS